MGWISESPARLTGLFLIVAAHQATNGLCLPTVGNSEMQKTIWTLSALSTLACAIAFVSGVVLAYGDVSRSAANGGGYGGAVLGGVIAVRVIAPPDDAGRDGRVRPPRLHHTTYRPQAAGSGDARGAAQLGVAPPAAA